MKCISWRAYPRVHGCFTCSEQPVIRSCMHSWLGVRLQLICKVRISLVSISIQLFVLQLIHFIQVFTPPIVIVRQLELSTRICENLSLLHNFMTLHGVDNFSACRCNVVLQLISQTINESLTIYLFLCHAAILVIQQSCMMNTTCPDNYCQECSDRQHFWSNIHQEQQKQLHFCQIGKLNYSHQNLYYTFEIKLF